jgi:ribosomal protein S27AE
MVPWKRPPGDFVREHSKTDSSISRKEFPMGLLQLVQDLINEHGSSSILRDRLLLLKDQIANFEKKCSDLEKELAEKEAELIRVLAQLEKQKASEKFVEHKGALFKRKPSGRYDDTPFCPRCKFPMGALEDWIRFDCGRCGLVSRFCGHDLPRIMKELEENE